MEVEDGAGTGWEMRFGTDIDIATRLCMTRIIRMSATVER